jgi:hypothetical protein
MLAPEMWHKTENITPIWNEGFLRMTGCLIEAHFEQCIIAAGIDKVYTLYVF